MSVLSYFELVELVEEGVITGVKPEHINSASIDVTLGNEFLIEGSPKFPARVNYSERTGFIYEKVTIDGEVPFLLPPGGFTLASTKQKFFLPPDISAEYKLKSSMARFGLEHLNAGWCDAGWNNSVLTLELKNMTRWHTIELRENDPIGQMIFYRHAPVPKDKSYAARGRYNGLDSTQGGK